MAKISLRTAKKVVPIIYAYTTPEIERHNGWTKIGYSERGADERILQQTHTADVGYRLEWTKSAIYDDGSGEVFRDTEFHAYLEKRGIERKPGTEWFHISPAAAKDMLDEFRENHGIINVSPVSSFILRNEQKEAVERAMDYFTLHDGGEFLFNCKPRFGKVIASYHLCQKMEFENILIVTNRPAIANSWYDDYCKFLGTDSGYQFVSEISALAGKPFVLSREEFTSSSNQKSGEHKCIEFVSLQDLKGSIYFGGNYEKLKEVRDISWDLLIVDEAHEGVDTYKTEVAFDHISRKYTLHLSGTPFKALANDKFSAEAIYNWTYADEQSAKACWDSSEPNPYGDLPQLNMYTYRMSEIIRDKVSAGIEIDGETEEYAFDLNEFFATDDKGKFVHNEAVNRFLNALTSQEKFPFSTPELRDELKHTLWLLNRVDSARALYKKLQQHDVFKDYKVILAAGDGRVDDADEIELSYNKVKTAISQYDKTITLSVGQLTTGVTIPEWTGVLMLSSIQSPALYMQSAFRAQNPCLFSNGQSYYRKENAYVFDFDPARTLIIFEEFANDLSSGTSSGRGDSETREKNVRTLLNFFPVIGEDENGEMTLLDASQVLTIPRKIKSQEVVRHGFMSDFLFQNISHVFGAPQEVIDIIKTMEPVKETKNTPEQVETMPDAEFDDNGDPIIPGETIKGKTGEIFGPKIYKGEDPETFIPPAIDTPNDKDEMLEKLEQDFHTHITDPLIEKAAEYYGETFTQKARKAAKRKIISLVTVAFRKAVNDYQIRKNTLKTERDHALEYSTSEEETKQIKLSFAEKMHEAACEFHDSVQDLTSDLVQSSQEAIVKAAETEIVVTRKKTIEDGIKDHLRGFSRTIPSFLMAYGSDNVTLETFDTIVPDQVFLDVTSISLQQFRILRDGGEVVNPETHKTQYFAGHLFDAVVFNDSVKEFLGLKKKLADYFDEGNKEDIFDYIPPQKTNQIFTPKVTVKDMVDRLEKENPGCYDDPDNKFADLYMKSGMYITEIVKRLYQSERMKLLYPDNTERLNHIFADQVYGLAPTEIIYRIALSYILGFSDDIKIRKHNIRCCDALALAKTGELEEKLKELFPELSHD